jgi:hypothetical protein
VVVEKTDDDDVARRKRCLNERQFFLISFIECQI